MHSQHSEDYKLSAVKYYIKINSLRKTCEIYECSKTSLQRWIERYFETVKKCYIVKHNSRNNYYIYSTRLFRGTLV